MKPIHLNILRPKIAAAFLAPFLLVACGDKETSDLEDELEEALASSGGTPPATPPTPPEPTPTTPGGEPAPTTTTTASTELELEKDTLKFGFIKLTDCAPIVIAKEKGFFEEEGLQVEVIAQPNWKQLLDNVINGELDGAHMLSG